MPPSRLHSRAASERPSAAETRTLPEKVLTDREYEVYQLLAKRLTIYQIVERLGISEKTVRTLLARIMPNDKKNEVRFSMYKVGDLVYVRKSQN